MPKTAPAAPAAAASVRVVFKADWDDRPTVLKTVAYKEGMDLTVPADVAQRAIAAGAAEAFPVEPTPGA